MTQEKLTALFAKLGASDAEDWASSQVREGIPQLARYLFLRQAWREVVGLGNSKWIDESRRFDFVASDISDVMDRCLIAIEPEDLTKIVRVMQYRLLFRLCYLLEDPGDVERDVADISWGLFQLDADGNPTTPISSLHESVMETNPEPSRSDAL